MEIKKMNDLKYALHFDNSIQAKKLYHYLYKRRYTAVTLLTRWGVIFVN